MANFPTSVYAPAAKAAGQTVQSAHVNSLDDEVAAIEDGYLNATARLNSSNSTVANLSVTGGSTLATLSVSSGITFSTVAASSLALDAYREGGWTPTANSTTFASATGYYTIVGNRVLGDFNVSFAAVGDSSSAQILGLPKTFVSGGGVLSYHNVGSKTLFLVQGGTAFLIYDSSGVQVTNATLQGKNLIGQFNYQF